MANYYYFTPRGKWKYDGEGVDIPLNEWHLNHDRIRELNGGHMPGISSNGKNYMICIVDDETSFPHFVHAEEDE